MSNWADYCQGTKLLAPVVFVHEGGGRPKTNCDACLAIREPSGRMDHADRCGAAIAELEKLRREDQKAARLRMEQETAASTATIRIADLRDGYIVSGGGVDLFVAHESMVALHSLRYANCWTPAASCGACRLRSMDNGRLREVAKLLECSAVTGTTHPDECRFTVFTVIGNDAPDRVVRIAYPDDDLPAPMLAAVIRRALDEQDVAKPEPARAPVVDWDVIANLHDAITHLPEGRADATTKARMRRALRDLRRHVAAKAGEPWGKPW